MTRTPGIPPPRRSPHRAVRGTVEMARARHTPTRHGPAVALPVKARAAGTASGRANGCGTPDATQSSLLNAPQHPPYRLYRTIALYTAPEKS